MTTPVTTPTNNPSKAQLRQALLDQLALIFPNAFGLKGKKPLKRGILEDILQHPEIEALGYSKSRIRRTLEWYVKGWAYLRAFESPDAYRIDLDGQKVAAITDSERAYAKAQFQKSQQRSADKIKKAGVENVEEGIVND
jgi:sRNA-binding protein